MAWQRVKIPIRKKFKPEERRLIAQDIIDYIVNRTQKGLDKNENPFPGYSKEYTKSLNFKIAGKSKGNVNLTLTEEMLNSIKLLSHKRGQLLIGFDKSDSDLNGKAEGNIRGTYGQKTPIPGKKRDFLGIKQDKKKSIQDRYDSRFSDAASIAERARRLRDNITSEDGES